jgi:hypothetical protein
VRFEGVGGTAGAATLPGVPDGYWGLYLTFCDQTGTEVLVLASIDDVAP